MKATTNQLQLVLGQMKDQVTDRIFVTNPVYSCVAIPNVFVVLSSLFGHVTTMIIVVSLFWFFLGVSYGKKMQRHLIIMVLFGYHFLHSYLHVLSPKVSIMQDRDVNYHVITYDDFWHLLHFNVLYLIIYPKLFGHVTKLDFFLVFSSLFLYFCILTGNFDNYYIGIISYWSTGMQVCCSYTKIWHSIDWIKRLANGSYSNEAEKCLKVKAKNHWLQLPLQLLKNMLAGRYDDIMFFFGMILLNINDSFAKAMIDANNNGAGCILWSHCFVIAWKFMELP